MKVNDGTITVSPGCRSSSIADSSSAAVHDVVISTSAAPVSAREQLGGAPGELPAGGEVPAARGLLDVVELASLHRGEVEQDVGELAHHGTFLPSIVGQRGVARS